MADKLLISNLTWRSLEMQKAAYPDMPFFVAPHEVQQMMRPTRRQTVDRIHVLSLGVISDNERDFKDFLKLLKISKAHLLSKEEGISFCDCKNSAIIDKIVKAWKIARKTGVAKIGGRISAAKREAESKTSCAMIADRWPLPNKVWGTPTLLKEADLSYNTVIKFLGKRPIAQYNYQAKLKRAARRTEK